MEVESQVGVLARRQHGVVTRSQLYAAGLTRKMVDRRVARGSLRRLHRGVYGVGPIPAFREREMAAVLACGRDAGVSHETAAWLWDIAPEPAAGAPVRVTVPGARVVRRPGIRAYRSSKLDSDDVGIVQGVPATSPVRTLVDLAASAAPTDVERAVARAERARLVHLQDLAERIARLRGRPGIATLAAILALENGPAFTRSALEDRFVDAVRRFGLADPVVNARIGRHEVDCYWPGARLVVELDGQRYHDSWRDRSSDRARDADLAARGIRVIRITWTQLTREMERTMMRVGQALVVSGG